MSMDISCCSPKNDSTKEDPDSEDDIYERFASTEDALKNILPDASKTDIEKYAQQLEDVENYDPILVISPNYNWIHQHSHQNYQKIMNEFATNGLQQNRRDKGSLCVFHFADVTELYAVRRNIRAIYPHAFFDPRAQPQQHPIGTAWVLYKIGMRKSDYDADECFFLLP
ncbi:603_t:CDS:2 [Paraglomus occultum]|uniref:603_t:CDS:1 n=1 Tax=Paraglomus occultum TaxID=144539 RepID=A0A9N9BT08_9GLOM|nr:603_t:CDS:2 [Paraglomus occultum]